MIKVSKKISYLFLFPISKENLHIPVLPAEHYEILVHD